MQNKFFNALFTLMSIFMIATLNAVGEVQLLEQAYLIQGPSDVEALFPKTVEEMELRFESVKNYTIAQIQEVIAIPESARTFEDTVLALDKISVFFEIYASILSKFKMVHPDEAIRKRAEELLVICTELEIDLFQSNREIYRVLKEYNAMSKEVLSEEKAYHLSNLMEGFKNAGFDLEAEKFEKLQELHKKIATLSIQFQSNISQDQSKVSFTKEELVGINDDFINSLTKIDEDYTLHCDHPTFAHVMSNCTLESTREKYYQTFKSRAYPANIDLLNQIINVRDELAHLLDYKSYAELDLVSTMAENIECVEKFLNDVSLGAHEEIKKSWNILMADIPASVELTAEGKIKPWDLAYLEDKYLKKYLDIDDEKIAEYFPMEKTIRGLLDIYEQFFNLKFQVIEGGNFWDPSVQMIAVKNGESNSIIGYILVDLFPRANKYSHACCISIVPPMSFDKGQTWAPALAVVIANFSKATETKPSLLKHSEVQTFFHEFGHAIHAIVGKAEMPTRAGFYTKFDFVETPSKLLEEWIWDSEILKNLSHHYQTGETLPDDVLERLIRTRTIQDPISLGAQILYAKLCLNLYKEGQNKDLAKIKHDVYKDGLQMVAHDKDINRLCAFVHLSEYGPKYYTYLWSEQLAKKIFNYIKLNGGLLDPEMGKRYVSKIIGRGGSCHPQEMIDDFLGNETAIIKSDN